MKHPDKYPIKAAALTLALAGATKTAIAGDIPTNTVAVLPSSAINQPEPAAEGFKGDLQ